MAFCIALMLENKIYVDVEVGTAERQPPTANPQLPTPDRQSPNRCHLNSQRERERKKEREVAVGGPAYISGTPDC